MVDGRGGARKNGRGYLKPQAMKAEQQWSQRRRWGQSSQKICVAVQ